MKRNWTGSILWRRRGGRWQQQRNLITDEGTAWLIDNEIVANTLSPGDPAIYIAPFSGDVIPLHSWTGANFAANATENTSTTEGYVEAARQLWVPTDNGTNVSNNLNPAEFNVRTATQVEINGFGLIIGEDTRGGVGGVLLAAVRFVDAPVLFSSHDILDARWTLTITVTSSP